MPQNQYLTKVQITNELNRCLNCPDKPCMKACPANCSPADFIQLAKGLTKDNYQKSAISILKTNPLGLICGLTCPDQFCIKACSRKNLDMPIKIPQVQATIIKNAREQSTFPLSRPACLNNKNVAIIGAGPAGMAASAVLARKGYSVTVFEASDKVGGATKLIPDHRLEQSIIDQDWNFIMRLGDISVKFNHRVSNPPDLLKDGYDGVIIAVGEQNITQMGIPGEKLAISFMDYLSEPEKYKTNGNVAILGGGAVATDCAITAKNMGATNVEMFVRRRICDMRLTQEERSWLLNKQIDITSMTRVVKIKKTKTNYIIFSCKTRFNGTKLEDIPKTTIKRPDFDLIIMAVGSKADPQKQMSKIIYAGDCVHGASTVVEAVASGKNAANEMHSLLTGQVEETVCPVSKVVSYKAKSCTTLDVFSDKN